MQFNLLILLFTVEIHYLWRKLLFMPELLFTLELLFTSKFTIHDGIYFSININHSNRIKFFQKSYNSIIILNENFSAFKSRIKLPKFLSFFSSFSLGFLPHSHFFSFSNQEWQFLPFNSFLYFQNKSMARIKRNGWLGFNFKKKSHQLSLFMHSIYCSWTVFSLFMNSIFCRLFFSSSSCRLIPCLATCCLFFLLLLLFLKIWSNDLLKF